MCFVCSKKRFLPISPSRAVSIYKFHDGKCTHAPPPLWPVGDHHPGHPPARLHGHHHVRPGREPVLVGGEEDRPAPAREDPPEAAAEESLPHGGVHRGQGVVQQEDVGGVAAVGRAGQGQAGALASCRKELGFLV